VSQGKVEFIKKATIQKSKLDAAAITFDEQQNVEYFQRILNAAIDTGDTIVDAEMPTSMFNATLDWSAQAVENDLVVQISELKQVVLTDVL